MHISPVPIDLREITKIYTNPWLNPDYDPEEPLLEIQIELTANEYVELLQFEAHLGTRSTPNKYISLSGKFQQADNIIFNFKPKQEAREFEASIIFKGTSQEWVDGQW